MSGNGIQKPSCRNSGDRTLAVARHFITAIQGKPRRQSSDRALAAARLYATELQVKPRTKSTDRALAAAELLVSLQDQGAAAGSKTGAYQLAQRLADQNMREAEEAAEEAATIAVLKKRNGKRNGRLVVPTSVAEGRIGKQLLPAQRLDPEGLYNPGSLCYRNALLQCLIHTPEFYHLLGNLHKDCSKEPEKCVTCALQAIVTAYWNYPNQPNEPLRKGRSDLNRALKAVFPKDQDIQNERQSDPYVNPRAWRKASILLLTGRDNCLPFIFHFRHEALQTLVRCITRDSTGVDPNFGVEPPIETNDFTIGSLFFVGLQSEWQCFDCQKYHTAPAPPSFGLQVTLLQDYHGTIEGHLGQLYSSPFYQESPFSCDSFHCQQLRQRAGYEAPDQFVSRYINHAPEILVIQLARNNFAVKLRQRVVYQDELNISRFAAKEGEEMMYKLNGVVSHQGSRPDSGHYIASVARQNPVDSFSLINDTRVSEPTFDANTLLEPDIGEVYMLIYSRV